MISEKSSYTFFLFPYFIDVNYANMNIQKKKLCNILIGGVRSKRNKRANLTAHSHIYGHRH